MEFRGFKAPKIHMIQDFKTEQGKRNQLSADDVDTHYFNDPLIACFCSPSYLFSFTKGFSAESRLRLNGKIGASRVASQSSNYFLAA
jgi:hypothetical protein